MTSEGNDIHFIECIALDCMATETGAQSGAFAFFGGARGKIIRCKVLGNSKGSNHHGVSVRNCIETVTILFTSNYLTFVNSATMKLAGAANFAGSNLDTLTLIFYNGVWYEKARSVN